MMKVPWFVPLPPWIGGDLQTLRNYMRPPGDILAPWPGEVVRFAMKDGTGDELVGTLHRPAEEQGKPLVLLLHGLTGCEESSYLRVTARAMLARGLSGAAPELARRGPEHGQDPGFLSCRPQRRSDRRHRQHERRAGAPTASPPSAIRWVRTSCSSIWRERGGLSHLRAAVAVSPPIDLRAAQQRIAARRNRRYHHYLLERMRTERPCPDDIKSILDFDNRVVAPANGFRDALDYYAQCSSGPRLGAIRTPTLRHPRQGRSVDSVQGFREIQWGQLKSVRLLMPWSGGHVGFHALGLKRPWHDEVALRFLAAT